jgi:hypothetical protein
LLPHLVSLLPGEVFGVVVGGHRGLALVGYEMPPGTVATGTGK